MRNWIYSVSAAPLSPPPVTIYMSLARYYVRKERVRLGVITKLCSLTWGGGGGGEGGIRGIHGLHFRNSSHINSHVFRPPSNVRKRSFLFFPKLNVFYCIISKCGSSAWSKVLLLLERGEVPNIDPEGGGGARK